MFRVLGTTKLKVDSITRGYNLKYEREKVNYLPRYHFLINRTANLRTYYQKRLLHQKLLINLGTD